MLEVQPTNRVNQIQVPRIMQDFQVLEAEQIPLQTQQQVLAHIQAAAVVALDLLEDILQEMVLVTLEVTQ
jgi:hypothetical protein